MKMIKKPLAAFIAMSAMGATMPAFADGTLEGRVANDDTIYKGAVIRIEELNREILAGSGGKFRMPQVKAGEYTLTVKMGGQVIDTRTITISDDEVTREEIKPQSNDSVSLDKVVVVGQAAQMQRALDRQRHADGIISAVNADAIGQLPDTNAAEALQRIAGLSIERDQGEGRFVRIRGVGAELNSVSVNGTQVPAPESGTRAVALDVIPSNLISALVVKKTLTPDMDANAIGGSIEIESINALDRDGLFYTATTEASYDQQSDQTSPKVAVSGGNTFELGEDRLGVAGAISWENRAFGSDNVETDGEWDFEDGKQDLENIEMREYSIERERLGAALNLDYELGMNTSFYLRNLYSEFKDTEQRQKLQIEGGPIGFKEGDEAEVERELKDREETQKILSSIFGAKHELDAWTIEYKLGLSEASEDEPDTIDKAVFKADVDDVSYSNTRKPVVRGPAALYDASEFELDEIETTKAKVTDKQTMAAFDITRDFDFDGNAVALKFGAKSTQREKKQDVKVTVYEDFSDITLDQHTSGTVDHNLGKFGPEVSTSVRNLISQAGESEIDPEGQLDSYTISEDINAGYVMGRLDTDAWRVIGGVRVEQTSIDSEGQEYEKNDVTDVEEFRDVKVDESYTHVLPSLQARFLLAEETQIRAAWTNSVVRPTFEQMRPASFMEAEVDDGETEIKIEQGNPELDAMESANFDLGIEHFMGEASTVSAFVFHKNINNFIFETDLAGSGSFAGDEYKEVKTYKNGEDATVTGVELAAAHKFASLPSPFNGLLVAANVTVSDSKATIEGFDDGKKVTRDITLPSQSDYTSNLTLGYEDNAISMRVAVNSKSKYLKEAGNLDNKQKDVYQSGQTQVDFNAAYNINKNLKVNFSVANLTDEPYYTYMRKAKYNNQYEDYGQTYRLGITYTNF